jgi:hypothetical protein
MRLLHTVLLLAALLVAIGADAAPPSVSRPRKRDFSPEAINSLRDTFARIRFAPMWITVPRFIRDPGTKADPSPPVAVYAIIWQREWQEELGLSADQKKSLETTHAKTTAESKKLSREFQKLSPSERRAKIKAWAGKPSPERLALENGARRDIEAVLTPTQLKTVREYLFPEQVVSHLYNAKVRQEIGFLPEQESQFRGLVRERLARFQEMSLAQAEKLWAKLSAEQQVAFREIVKHQGPTSAALSVAWELGFDFSNAVPGYPMLAETPVRKRLGLSAEQEKQLEAISAEAVSRQKAREDRTLNATPSESDQDSAWEGQAKQQVESILTKEQLTTLNSIDLRRQVMLAFGYAEKRKTAGTTEEQFEAYKQLLREAHKPMYDIDRTMLSRAVDTLTPAQKDHIRAIIDR